MSHSQPVVVSNWKEFEEKLQEIEADSHRGVWFRGLPRACWPLTTTLERRCAQPFYVDEYFSLMDRILPQVQTFTREKWEHPIWCEPEDSFDRHFQSLPALEYMTHLRHHGFPSPLLDWSRSPYIAAYFAFAKATADQDVAIFAYSEFPKNSKSIVSNQPHICTHGGFALKSHVRHFRQQSCYTVCVERPDGEIRWRFAQHERVFESGCGDQDRLNKIVIPSTERIQVLGFLERFNLNEFSLFGSEESLMETLAFQFIDQRN